MSVLLFGASAFILAVFSVLAAIAEWLDRRDLRRRVERAHRPRPFDRERDAA